MQSTVQGGRELEQRGRARDERVVHTLSAGVAVIHEIEAAAPPVAADDLRKAIQAALQRQLERELKDMEVDVDQGQVKLRGVVRTWREREAVLGAVRGTRGVKTIEHTLRVDPDA